MATQGPDGPPERIFFFQAEDGIRDYKVTGVQTCALPISNDIEYVKGQFQVKGVPSKAVPFGAVSLTAYVPHKYPDNLEPGLEETSFYDPSNFCFPFGAHACVVEVDRDTGTVKILRYVAVDDVGRVINPMIVDGMVHG